MANLRENQSNGIFDCSVILQKKYLKYFRNGYQTENEVLLNGFLDDMVAVTEKASSSALDNFIPIELLHSVCERFSVPFSVNSLREIVSGEFIGTLNPIEVFSLLWYFSCRNIFTFDDSIYRSSSKDGVIGTLLTVLKSKLL